ncbi:unnamed protein product [Lepeophtheirus salmonis]|uniref:(salmon louse) hypothetical protein n=1 Tax=Lepeophtheirus salmonis TaxID=72036 RepID=A0A7R8CVP6_LEPSM|nr:unnamed protein product [Lepeophtheirus salmonis]CAF2914435.1 unnamed protein product [Lepeophtheirus salmonis]
MEQSSRNCGKTHSHSKQECPAKGQSCNSCKKKGHYASMCQSSKVSYVYVGNVDKQSPELKSTKFHELRSITAHFFSMNGISVGSLRNVFPNSGASANFISTQNAERLGFNINSGKKTEAGRAFEEVKKCLVSPPILTTFDPKRGTMIQTDTIRINGLRYILLHKDEQDVWKLIEWSSRFVTETESHYYAMVELESLAAVWVLNKCHPPRGHCTRPDLGRHCPKKNDQQNINPVLKPYAKNLPHLIIDSTILFGDRIIIPRLKRDKILPRLHSSHQETERTLKRPTKLFFGLELEQIYATSLKLVKNSKVVNQAYPRNLFNRPYL